jgi:predicted Zn-dependent peptidase
VTASLTGAATELRRTVFPNGLTVLSEYMPGVRSVALGAWVRAASVHESAERMGISHMLEHMVFKGTPTRTPKDLALALETLGGALDAYTSREHTSYQAHVLDEHVGEAADVLADLIFRPLLRAPDLELEKGIVLEEICTVEDTPDDLVFELHNELVWGTHPYGYSILGTRESVKSLTVEDLRALHSRAYQPEQMVVVAAGSIEHDNLVEHLGHAGWADVPRGNHGPLPRTIPPERPPERSHFERDTAQTHVVIGSRSIAHNDPRRHAMTLVGTLLGGGMSSRLFQRVREELGLAYAVHTFQSFHADTGMHGVYVGTAPENAAAAMDAINTELRKIATDGIPADELAAGKNQARGQITLSLETPTSRMYRAAGAELYDEPFHSLEEELAKIDAIQDDVVAETCRTLFDPERQTVVTLGPSAP